MTRYRDLISKSLSAKPIDRDDLGFILKNGGSELLPLLDAAFQVRKKYFGKKVKLHILNNVQSGNCAEDCRYCAQSKSSGEGPEINPYPMKSQHQILEEARKAHLSGAFRHCLVFSGSKAGDKKVDKVCEIVKKIKALYPMEVCVSMGFLNDQGARMLREAGVNRYNHNLNSPHSNYGKICSTHSYETRLATLEHARANNLEICSGVIIGLGESSGDLLSLIEDLKKFEVKSVPINFFIPIPGHRVENPEGLTPEYCLRTLCLFRFALPETEIRIAGGREYHLRSMQAFSLYAVDSLFARGYLTTGGDSVEATRKMILDAGFELEIGE